jgi:cytochrome c oxidase cbb3-type subunit 3
LYTGEGSVRLGMMSFMRAIGLLLTGLGLTGVWAQESPPNRAQVSAEAVQRGREQFAQSCAFCHGPNATGGTHGPSLIRSAVVRHDENGSLIAAVIRDGRPDKGMPPVPLSANQVADIVAFLRSRLAVADVRSANRRVKGSDDKLMVGKAEAGKAFFDGAGGCAGCHSAAGDLAGIARKYPAADLQARMLYPPRKRNTATVTDSAGKQHTGELTLLTDYDVALQDSDGWYHSWPRGSVTVDVKDPLKAHRELLTKFTDTDMHNLLAYLETLK